MKQLGTLIEFSKIEIAEVVHLLEMSKKYITENDIRGAERMCIHYLHRFERCYNQFDDKEIKNE